MHIEECVTIQFQQSILWWTKVLWFTLPNLIKVLIVVLSIAIYFSLLLFVLLIFHSLFYNLFHRFIYTWWINRHYLQINFVNDNLHRLASFKFLMFLLVLIIVCYQIISLILWLINLFNFKFINSQTLLLNFT